MEQLTGIFDSHAHYDQKRFDADREEVIAALAAAGVSRVMNAASDLPSSRDAMALAEKYPFFWCSVGIHPHEAEDAPADYLDQLRQLAKHPKVQAIGEIGLDYHYDFSPRDIQRRVFEEQLILAKELDMPVIIHDREAHAETMELLTKYRPRGVVHCFSGSAEMAQQVAQLGMYVGFTGTVTFKNARKPLEAVAAVPEDKILMETDCPYMAPEPLRGRRCDSSMLPYTAAAMAAARGITPQQMVDIAARNACRLFGIE
ncbi:MAG: TatD family hydrolase [Oscillospiraceae bacterium]|nr:TatD family hydrolase [Oscillospiraceae bacterium]